MNLSGVLDPFTREKLQVALLNLRKEQRNTIVFVTHSVEETVFLGTRRVVVTGARPVRVILDRRIELPGEADGVRSPEVLGTPQC